jgi:hypothetical protein
VTSAPTGHPRSERTASGGPDDEEQLRDADGYRDRVVALLGRHEQLLDVLGDAVRAEEIVLRIVQDDGWHFGGTLEKMMHEIGMFDRKSPLTGEGLTGSGADWLERYKPYLDDGATIVTSPHKVYGPQNNDLALQLRKRGLHVVKDATAAANHPELGDGYAAALTNFGYLANAVLSTQDAVHELKR